MDHDHQWLINFFNASLDPNQQIRTFLRSLPSNKPRSSPIYRIVKEMLYNFLRSKALSIVYNCISMIGVMSGVYKTETSGLMLPMLQPWMEQFSSILKISVLSEDPNDWSIRMELFSAGSLLLAKILSYCGMEGVDAVIDSIERQISESLQKKYNGAHVWWILREAALFALASVSEQLLAAKDSAPEVAIMLEQILTDDVAIGVDGYPFLYARLFSFLAKFSSIASEETMHLVLETLLAAVKSVLKRVNMIVPGYYLDRYKKKKKKGGKTRQEEDFDQILAEIGASPPMPTSVAPLDVKVQNQPGQEEAADDKEGEEGITESVTSKEKKKKKKKGIASVNCSRRKTGRNKK
ncbi:hypothetical protein ACS0TY_001789 [Phlomoides rotata]